MAKYTVAVRPGGDHAILVTWRKWGWYSSRHHDATQIPYHLANFYMLMPAAIGIYFTERLYQLDNEQLAACKSTADQKVTRRGGLTYFTFSLSTTGNRLNA